MERSWVKLFWCWIDCFNSDPNNSSVKKMQGFISLTKKSELKAVQEEKGTLWGWKVAQVLLYFCSHTHCPCLWDQSWPLPSTSIFQPDGGRIEEVRALSFIPRAETLNCTHHSAHIPFARTSSVGHTSCKRGWAISSLSRQSCAQPKLRGVCY